MNMEITANNFRDGSISQVTIGYDWVNSENFALININKYGASSTYRISRLTRYDLYEDFQCMAISHCKFIQSSDGVFLSLDPFNELATEEENDRFCFWGESISLV